MNEMYCGGKANSRLFGSIGTQFQHVKLDLCKWMCQRVKGIYQRKKTHYIFLITKLAKNTRQITRTVFNNNLGKGKSQIQIFFVSDFYFHLRDRNSFGPEKSRIQIIIEIFDR